MNLSTIPRSIWDNITQYLELRDVINLYNAYPTIVNSNIYDYVNMRNIFDRGKIFPKYKLCRGCVEDLPRTIHDDITTYFRNNNIEIYYSLHTKCFVRLTFRAFILNNVYHKMLVDNLVSDSYDYVSDSDSDSDSNSDNEYISDSDDYGDILDSDDLKDDDVKYDYYSEINVMKCKKHPDYPKYCNKAEEEFYSKYKSVHEYLDEIYDHSYRHAFFDNCINVTNRAITESLYKYKYPIKQMSKMMYKYHDRKKIMGKYKLIEGGETIVWETFNNDDEDIMCVFHNLPKNIMDDAKQRIAKTYIDILLDYRNLKMRNLDAYCVPRLCKVCYYDNHESFTDKCVLDSERYRHKYYVYRETKKNIQKCYIILNGTY